MKHTYVSTLVLENYSKGLKPCEYIRTRESSLSIPEYSDFYLNEGLNEYQCDALTSVLGFGAQGEITEDEMARLSRAGLTDAFIDSIAGPDGREPVRARVNYIRKTLFDPPTIINMGMLAEIQSIGPDAAEIIPAIIGQIDYLTTTLHEFRDYSGWQYEYLDMTHMGNKAVRAMIETVASLNADGDDAVGCVLDVFLDDVYDAGTRAVAAGALGGLKASKAEPHLARAVWGVFLGIGMSTDDDVRANSAFALWLTNGTQYKDDIISTLIEILSKHNPASSTAATALGNMRVEDAVTPLMDILNLSYYDNEYTSRLMEEAAKALGKLGPKASEAVPKLIEVMLKNPKSIPLCRNVGVALGQIGSRAAIPALVAALRNGSTPVHEAAFHALIKLDIELAYTELLKVLNCAGECDSDSAKRAAVDAGSILLEIGTSEAINEIRVAIQNPGIDIKVRRELQEQLSYYLREITTVRLTFD